uniref:TATA box-binding protein-associated factor RNA polymerase I subunit D-like n=1 Tax=Pristiophorus japonicus TaxID=55135 RepID=UPI00398F498B
MEGSKKDKCLLGENDESENDESENSVLLFSNEEDESEQLLQKMSNKRMKTVTEKVDSASSIHSSEGDHVPGIIQNELQQNVLSCQPICTSLFSLSASNRRNAKELSKRDSSDSVSSLFKTQCPSIPVRKARRRGSRKLQTRSAIHNQTAEDTESSTDSDEFLGRACFVKVGETRRRQLRKRCKNSCINKKSGGPRGRPQSSTAVAEKRRRLRERGLQFPFVRKEYGRKHLPFKMIFTYEQAALCGLFNYMKELKCQNHLITSLKKINVDCTERVSGPVTQYKYLDEKRPISPLPESSDETCIEDSENEDTFDVKIVDNSCFIIEKRFEKKKKCLQKKNSNDKNKDKRVTNGKKKDNVQNKQVTVEQKNQPMQNLPPLKHFRHKTRHIVADQTTPGSPLRNPASLQNTCVLSHEREDERTQPTACPKNPKTNKHSKRMAEQNGEHMPLSQEEKFLERMECESMIHQVLCNSISPRNVSLEQDDQMEQVNKMLSTPLPQKKKKKNKKLYNGNGYFTSTPS